MTREWVARKNREQEDKIAAARIKVVDLIQTFPGMLDDQRKKVMERLEKAERANYPYLTTVKFDLLDYYDWQDGVFSQRVAVIDDYERELMQRNMYSRYEDSAPKHFDGDIVITDPCYVLDHGEKHQDDWKKCDYGREMEALGITTYMTRDTLYGDWGCTTYNSDTKEPIGHFCADAGLVSVFLLGEVQAYNPEYTEEYLRSKEWTATLIKDFKGKIQFVVEREAGTYEYDTQYWQAGDPWEEYVVRVIGHGVNKVTGEPINFITSHTGL